LIFFNITIYIAATVPKVYEDYATFIDVAEGICIGFFTIEYIIRMYVCIERKSLRRLGAFFGRLSYFFRFMTMIDLFTILPVSFFIIQYFLFKIFPDLENIIDQGIFGLLRLIRLFR
jgi:voltage-gated potassium channel